MNIEQRIRILEKRVGIKEETSRTPSNKRLRSVKEDTTASTTKILQGLPRFNAFTKERSWMRSHRLNDKTPEKYSASEVIPVADEFYLNLLSQIEEYREYLRKFSSESILEVLGRVHNMRRYAMRFRFNLSQPKEDLINGLLGQYMSCNSDGVLTYFKKWWNLEWNSSEETFE